jgi:hypothetical protein
MKELKSNNKSNNNILIEKNGGEKDREKSPSPTNNNNNGNNNHGNSPIRAIVGFTDTDDVDDLNDDDSIGINAQGHRIRNLSTNINTSNYPNNNPLLPKMISNNNQHSKLVKMGAFPNSNISNSAPNLFEPLTNLEELKYKMQQDQGIVPSRAQLSALPATPASAENNGIGAVKLLDKNPLLPINQATQNIQYFKDLEE